MQSEATHPHHYFTTQTVRAFAGLFGLVLLLLCTSQSALAQDARLIQMQEELDRLEDVVRLGKEAYYANPTEEAMTDLLRDYQAYEDLAAEFHEAVSQMEAGKGEGVLDTGGPDAFGYTYIDSNEPSGPSFSFSSISGSAGATMCPPGSGCGADDSGTSASLGFTFEFYGDNYTTTYVASNGYLNPTGDDPSDFGEDCPILNPFDPNGTIAGLWDDLNPTAGGSVWYGSFGSCPTGSYDSGPCFVAEWSGVPEFPSTGSNTFQTILYPDGVIENQYDTISASDGTSGIENASATIGLTYRCGGAPSISSSSAVRFLPPDPGRADLALSKTVSNDTPVVGDSVLFTITLTNDGTGTGSPAVRVNDLLPGGVSYLSSMTSQGSYNPSNGDWQVGTIAFKGTATLEIWALVDVPGTITNTAFVAFSSLPDPDPSNNSASATINPIAADLALDKQVIDFSSSEGVITAKFRITVVNQGPDDVCGVEVTDTLSPDMTLVTLSVSQGLVVAAVPSLIWGVGCLDDGDSATMEVTVTVPEDGNLVNSAEVTGSDLPDPDSSPGDGDGDDFALTTASPRSAADFVPEGGPGGVINRGDRFTADLKLDKTVDVSSAPVGGTVQYTIVVMNQGPQSTAKVEVTDILPACLTFDGSTADRGSYDGEIWDIGKIKVDESVTLTIDATVGPDCSGTVTNTAEVTQSSLPDPDDQFNLFDDPPVQDEIGTAEFDVEANSRQLDGTVFALGNNYPNPFNPETVVPYSLPEASFVSIKVYDLLGRTVATLVDGQMHAGVHEVRFDASHLPTAMYLIRMEVGSKVFTQRITLLK